MAKKKATSTDARQRDDKKRYAKFVAKVWSDEAFRLRVKSSPVRVLREFGFKVPKGKKIKIVEVDFEKTVCFVLPKKPADPLPDINVEQAALKYSFSKYVKEGVPFSIYLGVTERCYPCFI
jgi:hypothetical protein